jgi:hypothetical protein
MVKMYYCDLNVTDTVSKEVVGIRQCHARQAGCGVVDAGVVGNYETAEESCCLLGSLTSQLDHYASK